MNSLTEEIIGILTESFRRGSPVPLEELLWTIDAKYHVIPSVDEINSAIAQSPKSRIERNDKSIILVVSDCKDSDVVTVDDVNVALSLYQNHAAAITDKIIGKKTKQPIRQARRRSKPLA